MPRQSRALAQGHPPRDRSQFGQTSHYDAFDRAFGTAPRFVPYFYVPTFTPGPYTAAPTFSTRNGSQTMRVRGPTKAQCFDTRCARFLNNDAVTISKMGLADPRNPGPGTYEGLHGPFRPFGVPRRQKNSATAQREAKHRGEKPHGGRLPALAKRPATAPVPAGSELELDGCRIIQTPRPICSPARPCVFESRLAQCCPATAKCSRSSCSEELRALTTKQGGMN